MNATLVLRHVPANTLGVTVLALVVVAGRDYSLAGLREADVPTFRATWHAIHQRERKVVVTETAGAFVADLAFGLLRGHKGGGHVERVSLHHDGAERWWFEEETSEPKDGLYRTPVPVRLVGMGDVLRVERRRADGERASLALAALRPSTNPHVPSLEVVVQPPVVLDFPPDPWVH